MGELDPRVRYAGRSGGSGDWLTPPDLLAEIVRRWGIDFDPCPYPDQSGMGSECTGVAGAS